MSIDEAYNQWAPIYETNKNHTRDLEATAIRQLLDPLHFYSCLEIGAGTGKNTQWLSEKANQVYAVDFADKMLDIAKQKQYDSLVEFVQFNILNQWIFCIKKFDLITFSLVLEHIANLDHIFEQAAQKSKTGTHLYIGELHPFKQYLGTKARFNTPDGQTELETYTHHIGEFVNTAQKNGFQLKELKEYFDEPSSEIPRILALLFVYSE